MKTAKQKEIILEELRKNSIIEYACKRAGVGRATYYKWILKNERFAEKARKARDEGIDKITDMAEGGLFLSAKNGDLSAIKFILLHLHPSYMEKPQPLRYIEPIDKEVNTKKLSPEDLELIDRAIELDYGSRSDRRLEKIERITSTRIHKRLTYEIAIYGAESYQQVTN